MKTHVQQIVFEVLHYKYLFQKECPLRSISVCVILLPQSITPTQQEKRKIKEMPFVQCFLTTFLTMLVSGKKVLDGKINYFLNWLMTMCHMACCQQYCQRHCTPSMIRKINLGTSLLLSYSYTSTAHHALNGMLSTISSKILYTKHDLENKLRHIFIAKLFLCFNCTSYTKFYESSNKSSLRFTINQLLMQPLCPNHFHNFVSIL